MLKPPSTTKPSKPTRVDEAYELVKAQIRNNQMPPGFQLSDPELAEQLGMSRTPVREALIKLEQDGLIQLIPRHGFRVLPIRPSDMKEIYEILTSLEPDAAASLAARKPTAKELAPLDKAIAAMQTALDKADLDAWAIADDQFHQTLLSLNGNRRLENIVKGLLDQAHRARLVTLPLRELPSRSTDEHRQILEHLRSANAPAAREAFREHRQRASEELLAILEKFRLPQL